VFKNIFNSIKLGYLNLDPYFGLDPNSEIAGKLRARQMANMVQTAPLMMLANVTCAVFVFIFMYTQIPLWFLLPWTICVCLLGVIGYQHSINNTKRVITTASQNVYRKAARGSFFMGGIWALLPAMMYSEIELGYQVVILSVVSGILGGGAMSLYVIPRAMFIWIGLIAIGCMIGLLRVGDIPSYAVFSLLVVYVFALLRAGYSMAKTYALGEISSFALVEQSDTINLVLKDFSDNASDWLWEFDCNGKVIRGHAEFSKALRTSFISVDPKDYQAEINSSNDQTLYMRSFTKLHNHFLQHTSFHDVIISSKGADGMAWVSLSGKPLFNSKQEFLGFRGVASNITKAKLAEERIAYLAHNDALTGLVNRSNFNFSLEDMLNKTSIDKPWSVLYLDLDGFKSVNDTLGHGVGDQLLSAVATRLKRGVRDSDVVARLGGDEFAILSKSAGTLTSISTLADRLVQSISKPFDIDGQTVEISTSIGIAIAHRDGNDMPSLLNNADIALYRAKEEGRGTFRVYEHEMDEIVKERRSLENDLRVALRNDELTLAYQPLISSSDKQTTGFEALARWEHASRGTVSPADFIPIAERLGVIGEIGDWVIIEACKQAAIWPEHLTISVNLSPKQFHKNKILQTVKEAIKISGLNPKRLELEITEGLFMENTNEVMESLRELKSIGVSIAMDDFGTGYSSLSYLLKFPFDRLKIDRSFVSSIHEDDIARNVLEAIAKLGNVLNLTVTAEGVETAAQADLLQAMDCTHFQGFLFSRPLTPDQVNAYLLTETSNKMAKKTETLEEKLDFVTDLQKIG